MLNFIDVDNISPFEIEGTVLFLLGTMGIERWTFHFDNR